MIAAYLIDPARRRYPLDELLEQAGIEAARGGRARQRGARRSTALAMASSSEQIDRLELRSLLEQIELPLVEVLCRHRARRA